MAKVVVLRNGQNVTGYACDQCEAVCNSDKSQPVSSGSLAPNTLYSSSSSQVGRFCNLDTSGDHPIDSLGKPLYNPDDVFNSDDSLDD